MQQPEKLVEKLLVPEQVAEMMSISRVTVLRLAKAKRIPALKLGKVYRFSQTAIQNWVSAQAS
jgi:excisionase family DNA binding protein